MKYTCKLCNKALVGTRTITKHEVYVCAVCTLLLEGVLYVYRGVSKGVEDYTKTPKPKALLTDKRPKPSITKHNKERITDDEVAFGMWELDNNIAGIWDELEGGV